MPYRDREDERKYKKLYRSRNLEREQERSRNYYKNNKETLLAKSRDKYWNKGYREIQRERGRLPESLRKTNLARKNVKLKKWGESRSYEQVYSDVNGQCQICKRSLEFLAKNNHLDHDETTNTFRGILCSNCNNLIGHAHESFVVLEAAIRYLKGEFNATPDC